MRNTLEFNAASKQVQRYVDMKLRDYSSMNHRRMKHGLSPVGIYGVDWKRSHGVNYICYHGEVA